MKWTTASQLLFALTFIALGAIGLVSGRFAPIWAGVPKTMPDRELLAYVCAIVSLVCGSGLLAKRTTAPAALLLFAYLLVWTALFKFPLIVKQPLVEVSYQTNGENDVLIAAALVLYASGATRGRIAVLNILGGRAGPRIAYVLYGMALIAFGLSHFAYLDLTAPLVPGWLPMPVFWAYLTGCIYFVTGILLVAGLAARLGAALAAAQIALITLLVWGPMVLHGNLTAFHWQETVVSWTLTVAAVVIAQSFEGDPWILSRPQPRFRYDRGDLLGAGQQSRCADRHHGLDRR
jgi:uncharacterized membrane protein YphA (DoxX/SURF4 family)